MRPADGCVLDLDGTVYLGDDPIPGAGDTIDQLRRSNVPLCFATNTTRRPRSEIVSRLAVMGIEVNADELFTAPVADHHLGV